MFADTWIIRSKINFRDTLDAYRYKVTGRKIQLGHPESKRQKIRFSQLIIPISPNSYYTPSDPD